MFQALAFDLPNLRLADLETLGHHIAGLRNTHLLVLGLHEREKDFFSALLPQPLGCFARIHATSSSSKASVAVPGRVDDRQARQNELKGKEGTRSEELPSMVQDRAFQTRATERRKQM
jgi:hypothetical protein